MMERLLSWGVCVCEQETPDYGRPVLVVLEAGLQSPDDGPVLDPDRPSILRAEVSHFHKLRPQMHISSLCGIDLNKRNIRADSLVSLL